MTRTDAERSAIRTGQRAYWRSEAGIARKLAIRAASRAARLERRRIRVAEIRERAGLPPA